jgi:uncharacterized Zn-binding protein involved in type VI secretion
MPGFVQRVGDPNTLGGVIIEGDPTILVEGRPIAFLGAEVSPHPCCGAYGCPPIHCAAQTTSTNYTILVGGFPIITTGDIDTCGDVRTVGALTVIAGTPGT